MNFITFLSLIFLLSPQIDSKSIEDVKIGMTLEDFLNLPHENREVKKETKNMEGYEYVFYKVYQDEQLIYEVEPACAEMNCQVYRIFIYGEMFKTEAGVGVGSTIGDIRKHYHIKECFDGEGQIGIHVDGFDFTFLIGFNEIPGEWWNDRDYNKLDDNIKIEMIVL